MHHFDLVILLRLVIAIALTSLLGWERQAMGKAAGLRTHILVGFGATLFVGLGEALVRHFSSYEERLQFDPTRVLEAVVAGVAFLGAGMIFFSSREHRVHGLTTAASIWTTAGVGMAVGLGRYVLAMGATAMLLLVLRGLGVLENRWLREERQTAGDGEDGGEAQRRPARGLPPSQGGTPGTRST